MEVVDLKDLLKINIQSITFFGYFCPDYNSYLTKKCGFYIYALFMMGFWYFAFIISEIMNMIMVFGDIEKMTSASFLLLTHLTQVFKVYIFIRYNQRVHNFIKSLDRNEFQPKNEKQMKILKNSISMSQRITKVFGSMVVSTCVLWAFFPFLEGEMRLPLSGWYPFSTTDSPVFEITYLYQSMGAAINGLGNISIDTFITGNIMIVAAQLEILNDSIQNLKNLANRSAKIGENFGTSMRKTLIGIINHHRNILDYADEFNSLFNVCIMAQFMAGVIIICITMFQMSLVTATSVQFMSMVLYQACIVLEQFLYCYYGNEVIIHSNELTKSIYLSHWIDCSIEFKRDLLIFMTRTQNPSKLHAGGFFTLSLETFVTIMRTSWSYFAVLNHVHATE